MAEYSVTAMGPDRPGIVAAVAAALRDTAGNVEDSAMTILRGRFALVLLVATDADQATLEGALAGTTSELGLTVHVAPAGADSGSPDAPTHLLSVYGEDQPGILAAVSGALAGAGANVTDLSTRLLGGDDTSVWSMVVELATDEPEAVAAAVAEVAGTLGVDHSLRPLDAATY